MNRRHQYIALVTGLPHLGRLFSRKEVPISRFRLRQRLSMLEPEHARLIRAIIDLTAWAGVAKYSEDSEVIRQAKEVVADLKDYPDLQHLVGARMETRTLIAALRRRRNGQDTPGDVASWGYGRWCNRIQANWTDPAFGLGHFMPWVGEANRLLREDDHIGMERLALTQVFRQLDHYNGLHEFDFEAVVIYALRWVIVERWSRYNTEVAARRLEALTAAALGDAGAGGPQTGREDLFTDSSAAFEGASS
jgi:hypothetical protein